MRLQLLARTCEVQVVVTRVLTAHVLTVEVFTVGVLTADISRVAVLTAGVLTASVHVDSSEVCPVQSSTRSAGRTWPIVTLQPTGDQLGKCAVCSVQCAVYSVRIPPGPVSTAVIPFL